MKRINKIAVAVLMLALAWMRHGLKFMPREFPPRLSARPKPLR